GSTLAHYANGKTHYYRTLLAEPLPTFQAQVVPVAADSIAAQLGLQLFLSHHVDEAKRYWDAALVLNPNNTLALVGLGDVNKYAGEFDTAEPYYEKAMGLEPENAYHELDYAEYFFDRAQTSKDAGEVANLLTEARRHFARSYKLDPNDPETLAMNGAT